MRRPAIRPTPTTPDGKRWYRSRCSARSGILRLIMVRSAVAAVLCIAGSAWSADTRGVTPEDYFAFESISDAHISPDGQQVAYVFTTVDQKRNRRASSIWVVAADGQSAPRRLTADGVNSTAPRWSPDGSRIAFLS